MRNRMAFRHKNIRLTKTHYIGRRWYFITICCHANRPVFVDARRANHLIETLRRESAVSRFAVHAYCVMPDHFHMLVLGLDEGSDFLLFVRRFKLATTREFRRTSRGGLWQKKFYDHVLRPGDSPERVAAYIWMNPARKGLCHDVSEYPFCGSFVLDWKVSSGVVRPWLPPWKDKSPVFPVRN
jgi:putative transposase